MAGSSRKTGSRSGSYGRQSGGTGRSSSGARRSGGAGPADWLPGRKAMPARLHPGQQLIDWIGDVAKFVIVAVVILYCVSMSGKAYDVGYSIFYEEAVDEEGSGIEIEVTITEDMTVAQIGTMLEEAGLLRDGSVFVYQELFSSSHDQIVAGTYTLSTDMTPSDIISALAENYVESEETD